MALLDDALSGLGGGLLVGIAAATVVSGVLPIGSGLREVAKTLVKGYLAVADGVTAVVGEVSGQVSSAVAEARTQIASLADG
jgi:hypothetical protein